MANAADIVTGLVGHWKFNETSGTTAEDSSGSGNTGTLSSPAPLWVSGKLSNSLSFNGSNNYVTVLNTASLNFGTGDFSIACWFKVNALPNAWKGLVSKGASGSPGYAMSISLDNKLTADIQGVLGSNQHANCAGSTITANAWQHGVIVFKRNDQIYVYRNGSPVCASSYYTGNDSSVTRATNVFLGSHDSTQWYLNGYLDDVRIYSRALTAEDVRILYNGGLAMTGVTSISGVSSITF